MAEKVAMFVLNNFTADARVSKEAKSLVNVGYDVTVYAQLIGPVPERETIDGVRVRRVPPSMLFHTSIRFAVGGVKVLFKILRWLHLMRPLPAAQDGGSGTNSAVAERTAARPTQAETFHQRLRNWLSRWVTRARMNHYSRRTLRAVRKEPAAIYHAHDLNTLTLGAMAKRRLGGKLIYDSHELFTDSVYMKNSPLADFWVRTEERLIREADVLITVCDTIGDALAAKYQIPKPVILRNCSEPMAATSQPSPLRAAIGEANGAPIVLYHGKISTGRGLPNLVTATKYMDQAVTVIMGWGNLENELKQQVVREGLEGRVYVIPPAPREDLLQWSAGADIGIAPIENYCTSYYYSLPNKLFEYINSGLPVATSNFPEMSRIVEQYNIGRTFDPADPRSIGQTLDEMLGDRDRLAEMKRNVLVAAQELNWDVESKKLLALYRRMLEESV